MSGVPEPAIMSGGSHRENPASQTDGPLSTIPQGESMSGALSIKEVQRLVAASDGAAELHEFLGAAFQSERGPEGSAADWFNLSTELQRRGYQRVASQVALRGLEVFPYSADLLAVAVSALGNLGEGEQLDDLLRRAHELPEGRWTWRLFVFVIDCLQKRLDCVRPDLQGRVCREALTVARQFQGAFPLDERGYEKEAELLLWEGDRKGARAVLEAAVWGSEPAPRGIIAPQCCVTLIDEVLVSATDYEEVVRVAERGAEFTAQEQPSASFGYFLYRRALALDALWRRGLHDEDATAKGADEVAEAYGEALDVFGQEGAPEVYRDTAEARRCSIARHSSALEAYHGQERLLRPPLLSPPVSLKLRGENDWDVSDPWE